MVFRDATFTGVIAVCTLSASFTVTAQANDTSAERAPLNPDLLHWHGVIDSLDLEEPSNVREISTPPSRYSLYDAELKDMKLDLSVGFKPRRFMSLDAVW
ncbi:MAG: hypothetical protein AAF607_05505 [Pseudomonadota bacterium]